MRASLGTRKRLHAVQSRVNRGRHTTRGDNRALIDHSILNDCPTVGFKFFVRIRMGGCPAATEKPRRTEQQGTGTYRHR